MPDLTIWRLPSTDPRTRGHVVARGSAGVCYSLPELPGAWRVLSRLRDAQGRRYVDLLRWPEGECPAGEPLAAEPAAELAALLGLPGTARLQGVVDSRLVQLAEETLAELQQIELEIARAGSSPRPTRRAHIRTIREV